MKRENNRIALVGGWIHSHGMRGSRRADILVADGRIEGILAPGYQAHSDLSGWGCRIINVAGRLILPGFHDAHLHPTTAAAAITRSCWLPDWLQGPDYLAEVERHAWLNPDTHWISGRGWRAGPVRAARLDRRALDRIVPDRPVCLLSQDFHSVWVNSKALEIAGVDRSTPDPANGVIEKDADGAPNGFLHESAKGLVTRHLPVDEVEDRKQAILWAQQFLFSSGVTSWQDAWVDDTTLTAYVELAREGRLAARVVAALGCDPNAGPGQIRDLVDRRHAAGIGQLSAQVAKIMHDGVCEVGTAALHTPYEEGMPHRMDRGLTFTEAAALRRMVKGLVEHRFAVHFHCVGERSVTECIDACDAAPPNQSGLPHQLAHIQLIRDTDIGRMARLGLVANMQPASLCMDPATRDLLGKLLGAPRFDTQYPLAALRRAGVHIAFSSDWGVTAADPLLQIRAACGIAPSGRERIVPDNRLTLEEAVDAYGWGSTFASGLGGGRGHLGVGAIADLVILDKDIFRLEDIRDCSVLATMVGGRIVHARPEFHDLRSGLPQYDEG